MSEPTMTCQVCGRSMVVHQDGRGFPPDITRRKIAKLCLVDGHIAETAYRAGVNPGVIRYLAEHPTQLGK